MFNLKKRNNQHDALIKRVILEMQAVSVESDEYSRLLLVLERLTKLKGDNSPLQVSPDTLVLVIGNLIGVAFIIGYEQSHVITGQAMGWLVKPR